MTKGEEISTQSVIGKMPWEDLIDYTYYLKTQVKLETTIYEVKECQLEKSQKNSVKLV